MPGLISYVKNPVNNYITELSSLKSKALNVNKSVCNIEDAINSLQSSTQTQEQKINALDTFQWNNENFISDVVRIDWDAADAVNKNKNDFYADYYYLKPDCEKSDWENIWNGLVSAQNWCKKHWKLFVIAVLVIGAVAIIILSGGTALGAFGPLLLMVAQGILVGAAVGGIAGGAISAVKGESVESILNSVEDGAFSGAVSGAITGGMGSWLSGGVNITLALGETMVIGGVSNAAASVLTDLGNMIIAGEKISFNKFCFNTSLNFLLGFGTAGLGFGLAAKCKPAIAGMTKGRGSWLHVWSTQATTSLEQGHIITLKSILKGFGATTVKQVWDYACEVPKSGIQALINSFLPQDKEKVTVAAAESGGGGSGW